MPKPCSRASPSTHTHAHTHARMGPTVFSGSSYRVFSHGAIFTACPCISCCLRVLCAAQPLCVVVDRRRAQAALAQYTRRAIEELQADDDEMLRGVDWKEVAADADLCSAVRRVLRSDTVLPGKSEGEGGQGQRRRASSAHRTHSTHSPDGSVMGGEAPVQLRRSSLVSASTTMARMMRVPLLARTQSSNRAAGRYSTGAVDDDSGSEISSAAPDDVEAGGLVRPPVPNMFLSCCCGI